ncbi:MAG: signal peptidase I [Patescibacteria group bacterium]
MNESQRSAVRRTVRNSLEFLWEVLKVVIVVFAIIIPVRHYLIKPFYVRGASMEPNFHDYEYLVVDELSYRLRAPERGEVVVLKDPLDPSQYFIKRIVGLPGEHIVVRDGTVRINGKKLDETQYLDDSVRTTGHDDVTLQEGEYYLMGDNRTASLDSRVFGPLDKSEFVGRTWIRAWPLTEIELFSPFTYPE